MHDDEKKIDREPGRPATALSEDEEYWHQIQRAFDLDRTMINLNNGGS